MASVHSIQSSTGLGHLTHAIGRGFGLIFGGIASFFDLLRRANVAEHEYRRLTRLSDDELARMGLKREHIVRFVVDRL